MSITRVSEKKERMRDMKKTDNTTEQQESQVIPSVPLYLKHRPILALEDYESSDGHKAGNSEAKGLSIGLAQWNEKGHSEVSAKIWRYTGTKWSRQSEEMPLHRILDLTILIARARLLFKRYHPTDLDQKPGFPLIDNINLQGLDLPVSACTESETFKEDVEPFEKALNEEEIILRHRFAILTGILSETDKVISQTPSETPPPPPLPPAVPSKPKQTPPDGSSPNSADRTKWYHRIELKDIILTSIAFISIMTALFFAAQAREFRDLSIESKDIIISEASDDVIDLWIRQKNGIESVMITKQIIDYGTGTGHYACIDPQNLLSSEGEVRLADGIFLPSDEKGTPLVDSTSERHPALGAAYHLRIPREILYQTGDGNYHAMTLYDGSPLTITTFRKDYADYTGEYRINPFTLHAPSWPADDPYLGTYSLEALTEQVNKGASVLERQLRAEFNTYREDQENRYTSLKEEGITVAAGLEQRLDTYRDEQNEQMSNLEERGLLIASDLENRLRNDGTALAEEIESRLSRQGQETVTALKNDIRTQSDKNTQLYEQLRKEGVVVATGLQSELATLEQNLSIYVQSAEVYINSLDSLAGDVHTLQRAEAETQKTPVFIFPSTEGESTSKELIPPDSSQTTHQNSIVIDSDSVTESSKIESSGTEAAAPDEKAVVQEEPMSAEDILESTPEWRVQQLYSADIFMKEEALKLIHKLYNTLNDDMESLIKLPGNETLAEDISIGKEFATIGETVSQHDIYSMESRAAIREELINLQQLVEQFSQNIGRAKTSYLNTIDSHSDSTPQSSKEASEAIILGFTTVTEDLAELRNTVRMFNNMDIFSSIQPVDEAAVDLAIHMKYENRDLGQKETIDLLAAESREISTYEMFLIFSVFFNQYYL